MKRGKSMKATGIIRRVDELGRVVIPKEIRRNMGIEAGHALEIFTTHDGCVCFKKYIPYGEQDWEQVFKAVSPIVKGNFAILNAYHEIEHKSSRYKDEHFAYEIEIIDDVGEVVGYIATNDESLVGSMQLAAQVAKAILSEG
jgi:AbrB family looped-hinge helix DNA binding protein